MPLEKLSTREINTTEIQGFWMYLVFHFGRIGKLPLRNWEVEFKVLTLCRFWPGSSSDLPFKRVASSIHNGTF